MKLEDLLEQLESNQRVLEKALRRARQRQVETKHEIAKSLRVLAASVSIELDNSIAEIKTLIKYHAKVRMLNQSKREELDSITEDAVLDAQMLLDETQVLVKLIWHKGVNKAIDGETN